MCARLALWSEDDGSGLGRVEFVDERARLAVMAFLRRELENKGHQVHEIRCPRGWPPNQLARWLVEELGKLDQPATLISVEDLATAVEERELRLLLGALNFQREQLDPHSSRQIWWMSAHLATAFAYLISDLDSFFQLKLRLGESR